MSTYICTSMEECRRRGFTEFVAFKLPDGWCNVRGPSVDGRGYDRIVPADAVWIVEDLNAAMAVGRGLKARPPVPAPPSPPENVEIGAKA